MSGTDLQGAKMRGMIFANVNFNYARLANADCEASGFARCLFVGVTSNRSSWSYCRIIESDLFASEWPNTDFTDCVIEMKSMPDPIPLYLKNAILVSPLDPLGAPETASFATRVLLTVSSEGVERI